MSVNFQNINRLNPSFGAKFASNFKTVEKLVRELSNKGWQSSTYLDDVRYSQQNFVSDYHKGLAILKSAEAHTGIMRYRREFVRNIKCQNEADYNNILAQIIDKVKMLNCGESAQLVHFALNKLGIPSRIVSDRTMDHVFVVVNRTTPFTNYKNGKSGEFVADLWLKKVYKNVEEAYLDFKRKFNVSPKNELDDLTDKPFKYSLMRPLTEEEKLSNEKNIKKLFSNIDLLRKEVRCEAKELKNHTSHIQGRLKGQIKHNFVDIFEESINSAEAKLS